MRPHVLLNLLKALAARCAADLATQHPDYLVLAGRLEVLRQHKAIPKSFVEVVSGIDLSKDRRTLGVLILAHILALDHPTMLSRRFVESVSEYGAVIDNALEHELDFAMS